MSTSTNTFVMVDAGNFNQALAKINALDEHVRKLLAEKERREKYVSPEEGDGQYVTPKQLAEKLNKSISTIYLWRAKGIIHPKKIGRSTFFSLDQVLQILES